MPPKGHRKRNQDRRSSQVTFWVTPAEKDRIAANAARSGVKVSAYIRSLALGKPLRLNPSVLTSDLIRQLSRIANNLDQLLRHAQAGRIEGQAHIQHVYERVNLALEHWTSAQTSQSAVEEQVALLRHEGARVNVLATDMSLCLRINCWQRCMT